MNENAQNGYITILGCGDSAGVPRIGNDWGKCNPANLKNKRHRASIAVRNGDDVILVDTGPDCRDQLNRENITHVDAVLITHGHGDHVHGIDEMRVLHDRYKRQIDIYSNDMTIDELELRFSYLFKQKSEIYPAVLKAHRYKDSDIGRIMRVRNTEYQFFEQDHGTQPSLGFRFGDVGYSTDMVNLNDTAINVLKGVKTWIVDAANYFHKKVYVHANAERIEELNAKIGAENLILTHLKNDIDYDDFAAKLPANMQPAYDGMRIDFNGLIMP